MNDQPPIFDLILEPRRLQKEYWKDLWRFRELFFFLAWRDTLVRYKQAVFGVTWAILRPLLTMIIFTFVFGKLAKLPSEGVPYSLFVLAGMLPWQLFSSSLSDASGSVVSNANMISKIYFPRMIIPSSSVIVNLFDFAVTFVLLFIYMIVLRVPMRLQILTLPMFLAIALAFALGTGLWLAALNVRFRDFRYVIPFLVQFGLYLSPVGYASTLVPARYQWLYILNPMVAVIDGFRWALFGTPPLNYIYSSSLSLIVSFLLLASGLLYFRSTERTFADII